jgi:hypothetical protein
MFSISLRDAEHVRRYSVTASPSSGWEVILEQDRQPARRRHYDDWHRLECAVAVLKWEVSELTARGWQIDKGSTTP